MRSSVLVVLLLLGCSEEQEVPRAATDSGVTADGVVADTAPPDALPEVAPPVTCLEAAGTDPFFTLADATKCVVARYEVATGRLGALSWGRHNGPLGFEGSATPRIVRYSVPTTATGAATIERGDVAVTGVPMDAFWGSLALDLPHFNATMFSYTGSGAGFPGEVFVTGGGTLTRYHANGFYAAAVLGNGTKIRLLYTGLGALSATKSTDNAGGLYAADNCESMKTDPRFVPAAGEACAAPQKIATWEAGSSGPVAVDRNGNAFAILSKFGGKQELRAFEKSTIAYGAGPTAGNTLFSDSQYTGDLIADGTAVYWQPNDPTAFAPLDPMMLGYTVSAKTIAPSGAPQPFLKMKVPGTPLSMVADPRGAIWVGVPGPATSDAGPTSSTLFVIAKRP